MRTLTVEQVRALLRAAQDDRLEALYVLAVTTGMRRGELLGLRWSEVDIPGGALAVTGSLQRVTGKGLVRVEPKTGRSRRRILLTPTAIAALRRHQGAQAAERLAAADWWQDQGLVFCSELGTPLEPGNMLRRSFHPLLHRAGLPWIRFHDLRHTAATVMLGRGVHPKIASEMLGHATVGITLDTYSHVTETMQRVATEEIEAALADG
jgi:integrase